MDATTTAFSNLLSKLKTDFPHITFQSGEAFRWSPSNATVFYTPTSDRVSLLHEVAHAVLGHTDYTHDLELLRLERDAWTKAIELGRAYAVQVPITHAEDALDTYRDWLHARSLCPVCNHAGVQAAVGTYQCVICEQSWRPNDARTCGLRRHPIDR